MGNHNNKGRKPLDPNDKSVDLVFTTTRSMETEIETALDRLRAEQIKVSKSELIRSLVGFRLVNAVTVFKEYQKSQ